SHYALDCCNPKFVVFNPDGSRAYVLSQSNYVQRITTIDVATSTPVGTYAFNSIPYYAGDSYFFRISPDGAYLYGGGNGDPGDHPDIPAWSVNITGLNPSVTAIPSAQGVMDIAVRPPPLRLIDAGAATLVSESIPNGQLDPGELVTVSLCITNGTAISSGSVTGTLLAAGGVVTPSGLQSYGPISAGGNVCRN